MSQTETEYEKCMALFRAVEKAIEEQGSIRVRTLLMGLIGMACSAQRQTGGSLENLLENVRIGWSVEEKEPAPFMTTVYRMIGDS